MPGAFFGQHDQIRLYLSFAIDGTDVVQSVDSTPLPHAQRIRNTSPHRRADPRNLSDASQLIDPILVAVITLTAAMQSVIGIGVLMIGTPTLLMLGYPYIDTLSMLLPVSLTINLLQISRHWEKIDFHLYRKIALFAVPLIVISLQFVVSSNLHIDRIVALFLALIALSRVVPAIDRGLLWMVRYETPFIAITGIVHGLTNLGGPMLTAIVHAKGYDKYRTRATIAMGYATFAAFQVGLIGANDDSLIRDQWPTIGALVAIGIATFLIAEKYWYHKVDEARYQLVFSVFLLLSGIVIALNSI